MKFPGKDEGWGIVAGCGGADGEAGRFFGLELIFLRGLLGSWRGVWIGIGGGGRGDEGRVGVVLSGSSGC